METTHLSEVITEVDEGPSEDGKDDTRDGLVDRNENNNNAVVRFGNATLIQPRVGTPSKEEERKHYQTLLEKEMERALRTTKGESSDEDSADEKEKLAVILPSPQEEIKYNYVHYPSLFDTLPDETLLRIWKFLDPPSIGRMAQVCRRFREMSYDLPMWRDASLTWGKRTGGIDGKYSYSFFVKRFCSYRRGEKLREEQRVQEENAKRQEKRRQNAAVFMKATCYARFWEWVAASAVVLVTILSVLKLDEVIDASWGLIMIPFFVLVAQMIIAPTMYDAFRGYFNYSFEKELEPDEGTNRFCGPIFFFLAFPVPMQEALNTARAIIYPTIVTFSLWLVLLIYKIDNPSSDIPYWGVFFPLLFLLIITSQVPLWIRRVGYFTVVGDHKRLDRILISVLVLIAFVFVLFLVLKLDEKVDWSWYQVLIPLWVLQALLVFIPIVFSLTTLICNMCANYTWEDVSRWSDRATPLCLTSVGFSILVLAPLFTFEVLLAKSLEGDSDISYALIFIPIFILEGFGICGCCIVNCAFLFG